MTKQTEAAVADVQDAVRSMIHAQTTQDVWGIYAKAMTGLGFDKLLYGGTRLPRLDHKIGDIRDALILHYGPQEYVDLYLGEELFLHSPSYAWAAQHSGFASWQQALSQFSGEPRPEHLRILQLNAQFGVFAGYVGSLDDLVRGMHGVIGVSPIGSLNQADTDLLWADVGRDVEMLSNLLQLRIASLPMAGQRRPLTSRQRESLNWCAQGKTMQDIADIMDLSAATIEKHLRMAREALDATTTAHAVQKATSLNLLVA
ncbi:MAG: autoinducer binding domain-containing protein [Aliishimia sp.]